MFNKNKILTILAGLFTLIPVYYYATWINAFNEAKNLGLTQEQAREIFNDQLLISIGYLKIAYIVSIILSLMLVFAYFEEKSRTLKIISVIIGVWTSLLLLLFLFGLL